MIAPGAAALVRYLDRRGWVTWEREDDRARVLIVTNAWPERGAVRAPFVAATVDGLESAGCPCDVLYVRGYLGLRAYLLGCLALALLPLARPGKYRLVNSQGGETAVVARFFLGGPVLATYLGSDLLGPAEGRNSTLRSRLLRRHSALMTATTTKTGHMQALLPARARPCNWVIPDGIDRERFGPVDRAEARRSLGWPAEEVTVISVGRAPVKRLWLAEQAVARAAERIDGLRWRVISDVPPEAMPLIYNAADLLLHTSASEGSPNAIKEALACNLPVVATPAGDIAQLLDGVAPSSLCQPRAEALAEAIVTCLRAGVRSNGRQRTAPFSIEATTARLLDCYASLGLSTPVR